MVELTITVGILTLVVASLLGTFVAAQRSQAYVTDRSETLDELRQAMDRITKEVRQATWMWEWNSSNLLYMRTFIAENEETVLYWADGSTLWRYDEYWRSRPILDGMTTWWTFTFSPSAQAPTTVRIRLRARPDQSPNTVLELSSEVRLRNLG